MPTQNNPFEYVQRWPFLSPFFPEGLPTELTEHLDQRDRDLEDFLSGVGGVLGVIDYGDALVMTGFSKSFRPLKAAPLSVVAGGLEVAGTTSTVTKVYKNGLDTGVTLTIPAGATYAETTTNVSFGATDRWQMLVTSAGTGANAATFYGRFG